MKNIFIFFLIIPFFSQSQNWQWDDNFGNNGVLKITLQGRNTRLKNMELLNDNSIILGVNSYITSNGGSYDRDFYIYKVDQNGNLDNGFGNNGFYHQTSAGGSTMTRVLDIKFHQIENSIYILSEIAGNKKVFKLNQSGEIDMTFGINGFLDVDANKMEILNDGKILLMGYYSNWPFSHYKLNRIFSSGNIDSSFGNNGEIILNPTSYNQDLIGNFKILSGNKIIIAGYSFSGNDGTSKAVLVKLNENGTFDTTFANNGVLIEDVGPEGKGKYYDLTINDNGFIIVNGTMYYQGVTGEYGTKAIVSKYNSTGYLDQTFDDNGIKIFDPINGANDSFWSIDAQSDEIIAVGTSGMSFPNSQSFYYMALIDDTGNFNANFFSNGYLTTNFQNSPTNNAYKVFYLNDEIYSGGISKNPTNSNFEAVLSKLNQESLTIDEWNDNNNTVFYPNPFSDELNISHTKEIKEILIYTISGKLIYKKDYTNVSNKLSLNINIPAGIYLARVLYINGNSTIKKIIKN